LLLTVSEAAQATPAIATTAAVIAATAPPRRVSFICM
jgi:hypothetical protein